MVRSAQDDLGPNGLIGDRSEFLSLPAEERTAVARPQFGVERRQLAIAALGQEVGVVELTPGAVALRRVRHRIVPTSLPSQSR